MKRRPLSWCAPALVLCVALGLCGCGEAEDEDVAPGAPVDDDFVQPGLDDPTARTWKKAGDWYEEDRLALERQVDGFLDAVVDAPEPRAALATLTPHASMKFSGAEQAEVYARVTAPDVVILLAPNHSGAGASLGIWNDGPWLVPGHALSVRNDLVDDLKSRFPDLMDDRDSFDDHPAELQLPFLAALNPDIELIPISFFDNSRNAFKDFDVDRIKALGEALAALMEEIEAGGQSVMIAATTDLVHREPLADVEAQDEILLTHIADLDTEGLYDYVTANSTTICGEIPTAVMMEAVKAMGASEGERIIHGTSVAGNGNVESVIGYPGVIIWK